jgi:hypothetical protein
MQYHVVIELQHVTAKNIYNGGATLHVTIMYTLLWQIPTDA